MSPLHLSGILSTLDIFKIVLITFLFNNNSVREVILLAIFSVDTEKIYKEAQKPLQVRPVPAPLLPV